MIHTNLEALMTAGAWVLIVTIFVLGMYAFITGRLPKWNTKK